MQREACKSGKRETSLVVQWLRLGLHARVQSLVRELDYTCHKSSHASVGSLMAQGVKNTPAMQETQVQPLGREDLLEEEMATHSSILAGKSHG